MWPFKKRQPYVPTGRVGLIQAELEGNGRYRGSEWVAQVKVEELETFGGKSKVKVLAVYGVSGPVWRAAYNLINGMYWPTDEIEFGE